ncbi:transporter [Aphanothece hegewaldii CCALA 016]|uniref:Transporter n=1 Tax=Aphanothece hegewaldii CCALA 016 TaxID=2107694 RepID=A0A2T1LWQ2_9CHRO|nr:AEC family transporter [Aphanothece hegewaldii]PSF36585.1 transporter [Aphanothece hegewaldii CCALA 016]
MNVILSAIIPVGLIIFLGYVVGRTLRPDVQSLSQISVYILAPALVADGLYQTTLSGQNVIILLLGFGILSVLLYGLVWLIAKLFHLSPLVQKSLMATTILPNNGNMGLSITSFALGAAGLERAIIYMIGSSILLFGVAPALLKGKGFLDGIRVVLKLPLIWAMLWGISLRVFAVQLPFEIDKAIAELGRAAIPVALIILGIQLASTRLAIGKYELFAASLRLILAPFVAWVLGMALGLKGLDAQIFIIQSAMPTAVNTVVLVTEFGGDAPRVARTIVVTTLGSFLTVPFILWLVTR